MRRRAMLRRPVPRLRQLLGERRSPAAVVSAAAAASPAAAAAAVIAGTTSLSSVGSSFGSLGAAPFGFGVLLTRLVCSRARLFRNRPCNTIHMIYM
jgi:hypothetical protein